MVKPLNWLNHLDDPTELRKGLRTTRDGKRKNARTPLGIRAFCGPLAWELGALMGPEARSAQFMFGSGWGSPIEKRE